MLEWIIDLDKKLLIAVNSWHSPVFDNIIITLTNGLSWTPLFALVIAFLIYRYRWHSITILLFLGLVILLADQISAGIIKPWVARVRPSHNPLLEGILHHVNDYRGGLYGFVSSHAANAFAIATFLWLITKDKIRWIWVMFIWAIIFTYTRLYLGVHYPLDIIGGGLLGAGIGWLVYFMQRYLPNNLKTNQT